MYLVEFYWWVKNFI